MDYTKWFHVNLCKLDFKPNLPYVSIGFVLSGWHHGEKKSCTYTIFYTLIGMISSRNRYDFY